MSVDEMRVAIVNAYKGPAWRVKVRNMSDEQVIAIYYRITNGKTARRTISEAGIQGAGCCQPVPERCKYEHEEDGPKQMTFADVM